MTRRAPRPLATAVKELTDALAPATPLAAVQRIWDRAVGGQIASQAAPTAFRDGILTVSCAAAVWAHELDLMGPEIVDRLNAEMGSETVLRLRCKATAT